MPIAELLEPRIHDLGGGLVVRRLLPSHPRQAVGPFVFFDHFGPVAVRPQDNFDVRPHPHIGLATVTYLFEGAMLHRDSMECVQRIEPGAINWMTAGSGVVHSERRPPDLYDRQYPLHGLQLWAALPREHEECEPSFTHTPASAIPATTNEGVNVRVLIGEACGARSPVATFAPTLYLDIAAEVGGTLVLPAPSATYERAVYSVERDVVVDGRALPARVLAPLEPGADTTVVAPQGARFVEIGGEPLDGRRYIFWNFVSSSRERIERAKEDWRAQRMAKIPGEHESIPLP